MEDQFRTVECDSLIWPSDMVIPSKRFRLFVAADVSASAVETISDFALQALNHGMVCFSVWGPDCRRFHDIMDEVTVDDELGDRKYVGPNDYDTIMTDWHEKVTLEEAIDFFVNLAYPTGGFEAGSNYWLAISVGNEEWARTIRQKLNTP